MPTSIRKGKDFVAEAAVARSPIRPADPVGLIAGWEVSQRRSGAALRLADLTPLTKIGVKAAVPPFPVVYGRSQREGEWLVTGSGPGEWTLLGPPGAWWEVPGTGFTTVIDLTHGRALLRLTGADSRRAMEKVCAIDLTESMCPDGAVFRAPVAGVVTDVVRLDRSGQRSYLLHCERSSGQFLFDALGDAGAEFGLDVDGFQALFAT
jgi:heterotetrameric sarcosine oxidase gamma subunit